MNLFLALEALGIMLILMCIVWLYAQKIDNAGIVDVVWAFSLGGIAIYYLCRMDASLRGLTVVLLMLIWSLRLGIYLLRRFKIEPEDGRYVEIKETKASKAATWLFVFFMIQAFADVLLSLSLFPGLYNNKIFPNVWDIIGICLAVFCVISEGIADAQLAQFKNNPKNQGKTCRIGLWKYSRHPNYFFEWLYWFSFVFLAIGSPYFWISLISPILMLILIIKVSGIPPTEKQALKTRGEDYVNYQQETSCFFPWFPKKLK